MQTFTTTVSILALRSHLVCPRSPKHTSTIPYISNTDSVQANTVIDGLADFFAHSVRTPILRRPDEYGLDYEDVFFLSLDEVPLEGWFIPAKADRLIICKHFMPGNRYGYPGHMDPWKNFGGFKVNFLPGYKALHDAGFNVLAYDLRNHGLSRSGNGGLVGIGLLEYRDVVDSLRFARARPDLQGMKTGLLSICLGCSSTIVAVDKHAQEFNVVLAMVALQPVSARPFIERAAEGAGIANGLELFDAASKKRIGFGVDELSPINYAKSVTIPTLVAQVREDQTTKASDVQAIYDAISATDKRIFWIEGTKRRFDGYNYFSENPEMMVEWFSSYFG